VEYHKQDREWKRIEKLKRSEIRLNGGSSDAKDQNILFYIKFKKKTDFLPRLKILMPVNT
jgi:hypothetical protein